MCDETYTIVSPFEYMTVSSVEFRFIHLQASSTLKQAHFMKLPKSNGKTDKF